MAVHSEAKEEAAEHAGTHAVADGRAQETRRRRLRDLDQTGHKNGRGQSQQKTPTYYAGPKLFPQAEWRWLGQNANMHIDR